MVQMQEKIANRPQKQTTEEEISEVVFKNSYIPRSLNDVVDYEKDYDKISRGDTLGVSAAAPSSPGTAHLTLM